MIGLGISHTDLIKLFLKKGFSITICDKLTKEQLGEKYDEFKRLGANFILGDGYLESLDDADVVFRSPGMYYLNKNLQKAKNNGVIITSEMEMFFELCPCPIYAVTGSDGKTTTTTLISEMLKSQGYVVHLGGNIGKALLPIVESIDKNDIAVVELSSFQLLPMTKSPSVAVITNISPNHLDVHKDMDEYITAKTNLLLHQSPFSMAVLNLDNKETLSLSSLVRGEISHFSRKNPVTNGAFLDTDGYLCRVEKGNVEKLFHMDEIKLPGIHNVENYLAAISAVSNNVDAKNIVNVAKNFGGVEHRIEFVKTVNGVKYYNDSIASSPTRTIAGLHSFEQKIIVIAGGYDKNIPYDVIGPHINECVKVLILLGDTAEKINTAVVENELYNKENIEIIITNTLENAVITAKNTANTGDIVILSPASASFDLYKNFEERGNHFKLLVDKI